MNPSRASSRSGLEAMASSKRLTAICLDEVDDVFDDATIDRLVLTAKLPPDIDRRRLAEGIRDAARIYVVEKREPTANDLHAEIGDLFRAASRKDYEVVVDLLRGLSPSGRASLSDRGSRPGVGLALPQIETLADDRRRDDACKAIVALCQIGGRLGEGRRRPNGRRSTTWIPVLHAPPSNPHPRKRSAEEDYIMWLGVAWLEATGTRPPRTGLHDKPGPFARLVRECLRLIGGRADGIAILNRVRGRKRERMR